MGKLSAERHIGTRVIMCPRRGGACDPKEPKNGVPEGNGCANCAELLRMAMEKLMMTPSCPKTHTPCNPVGKPPNHCNGCEGIIIHMESQRA